MGYLDATDVARENLIGDWSIGHWNGTTRSMIYDTTCLLSLVLRIDLKFSCHVAAWNWTTGQLLAVL
ncbi:hypothetical protein DL93DRAFT_2088782 [Clavulina sp. PMI_390]|nr:hypothetical protein DL93DRAFT_2088782 [Clavulina sp. PMI_390]